ncbi:MAG: hypothetical protein GY950_27635, partial [bacterium]|nr:hypothetical protein [bacterium]
MIFESYINKKRNNRLTIMAVLVFCCLMFTASHLAAADHWVYGQVFRVTSEELAEKQKAADDAGIALDLNTLETEKLPYVHIKIYDKATGKLLMTGDALNNGQYTIKVSLTGPPPAAGFDCRVFKTADGKFQLMKEVKDGVNSVSPVGSFNQKKLLVIDDDIIDYKIASLPAAGVGLVFTRVGLIPVAYIEQSAAATGGMSNIPNVSSVPGYVPTKFREMELPFGGALLIFGNFGEPTCGPPGTKVGWYRVTMENITAGTSITLKDPLSKVKTDV